MLAINICRIRFFDCLGLVLIKIKITSIKLILLVSLFITVANNQTFFAKATDRLDLFSFQGAVYVLSIYTIVFIALVFIHLIFGTKFLLKPLMIFLLIVSAGFSYFTQELGVVFDDDMIRNLFETIKDNNQQEATELLSFPLIKHVIIYGLIPAVVVMLSTITYRPFFKELFKRFAYALGLVAIIVALVMMNFKYTSFFSRENRDLRLYLTPVYALDSVRSFTQKQLKNNAPLKILATDATQYKVSKQRTIGVMVVGETARASNFSLNGYAKETNPRLKKEALINYTQATSCGTSTAFSVPCMFSFLDRSNYSPEKASQQTNALDALVKAGVKVVWLDNNSSCKGVCERTGEVNLRHNPDPKSPYYFDGELFDEALIAKTDELLSSDKSKSDILFVLHTLGSHGPKYYKRYPQNISQFKPACTKSTPQECSDAETINAYDNTILYTDFILSEIIQYLKNKQSNTNETFMIYASDHGESLGEKGVYLHGLPYFLAPKVQTHIPMIMWLSDSYKANRGLNFETLKDKQDSLDISHDNLSHSLLGAFGIESKVYKQNLDLLR